MPFASFRYLSSSAWRRRVAPNLNQKVENATLKNYSAVCFLKGRDNLEFYPIFGLLSSRSKTFLTCLVTCNSFRVTRVWAKNGRKRPHRKRVQNLVSLVNTFHFEKMLHVKWFFGCITDQPENWTDNSLYLKPFLSDLNGFFWWSYEHNISEAEISCQD